MFPALSLSGCLRFGAVVATFVLVGVLGVKTVMLVTSHFDHVRMLEETNQTLKTDNKTLNSNNAALKASLSDQQVTIDRQTAELAKREADNKQYELKQAQLELDLQKLREESNSEIQAIYREMRRAGIGHIALPDNIVRMQRERAKAINARSRDRYQSAGNAATESTAVPAVPGS